MRQLFSAVVLVVVLTACAQAQTVVNPTAIRVQSSSHTADELSKPTEYKVDFFATGATEPTQTNTVPYASVTAVPSTNPQQYELTFAAIGAYPVGQTFTAKVRAVNAAGTSGSSNAVGPFGLPTAPASPTTAVLVP